MMLTFVSTWACDTSAYLLGKAFGRTKIAPKLSPNKTVEGSIAGLLEPCWSPVSRLDHSSAVVSLAGDGGNVRCALAAARRPISESSIKRELDMKGLRHDRPRPRRDPRPLR